ncbi:4-hydroxythreonine-4-phosphate dehydrogenase PdxA [Aureitalea marina]|uniref:4-hydroxythreonine-4-phosphate dehydrogenase PdxA n=1 Tax=Aureitalea marina TaxID=930804 RepID=A0A2S7KS22_9FLAO|nr:4-hydroxythreonine-4-phosphate dehydrogenase PdxA [Aureitalea marina]PQB05432.1 4-hydroxythreonine-4-phosphate dehydrogenase PdxA [Aureitalea marina]
MATPNKIKVGVSIGDLNGIGSEIILKTFSDNRMLDFCTPVIFGSVKLLSHIKKELGLELGLQGIENASKAVSKKVNVVNVWKDNVTVQLGAEDPSLGKYAVRSLEAAVDALKSGGIDVLVTAPIHKSNVQSESFQFPGHTDYLAQALEGESLMLMVSSSLRVGLLTDHLAVKDVSAAITPDLIKKKVQLMKQALIQDFGLIKPKIAMLGINPHTGDNGVIGSEDDDVMRPTLDEIRQEGTLVFGPYAADSFFGSGNYENFDGILAAYHDQGLIPFKTLSFGRGVNFTAGLSRIRTSPDHGTAFDLAGKNEASFDSFKEAVFSAVKIYRKRTEYAEISANPLKTGRKRPVVKKKS